MKSIWTFTGPLAATLALVSGCSETPPHLDEEGCEHLQHGPSAALTATADADLAPSVGDHKRYDVTLLDVAGGKGGFVKFAAAEAADFLFFLGADVPLQVLDAMNSPIAPETSATSSTACAEIKGRHVVPLEVGTYALQLGPTTSISVGIVIEEKAHDH